MSKAYEMHLNTLTMKNEATTTMKVYSFVRLCTTNNSVDIISTRGTHTPCGITQEAINPSEVGKIAIDGMSRLKMGSTAMSTMYVTTPQQIGANASSLGCVLTTSTSMEMGAVGFSTFAASDIVTVKIACFRPIYRL